MIRYTSLLDRFKLALAIVTGRAKVTFVEDLEGFQKVNIYIEPDGLIVADR